MLFLLILYIVSFILNALAIRHMRKRKLIDDIMSPLFKMLSIIPIINTAMLVVLFLLLCCFFVLDHFGGGIYRMLGKLNKFIWG
jgi:multisubunit Na+/H+ antiporter MnhB subunit